MLPKFIVSQFKKPTGLLGTLASSLMSKSNHKHYDRLIKSFDLRPHDKLLEIGYGPGTGIQMVAQKSDTCTIHGIDFSQLMYTRASDYNAQYIDQGRVRLQQGDFLTSAVSDSNYDIVFCVNVVHFWTELSHPFQKVYSLLKKGGVFYVYMLDSNALAKKKVPDSVVFHYSTGQIVEALKAAGFDNIEHYIESGLYVKALK